jgi:hypothetical protein
MHGRLKSAMSSIGTPNRRYLDASLPRTYCYRGAQANIMSAIGTKQTRENWRSMSAFGGNADIQNLGRHFRFRPKADTQRIVFRLHRGFHPTWQTTTLSFAET